MARSRAGWTGTRIVALVAGVVLIIVAAVVVTRRGAESGAGDCLAPVAVRGVIGSEKESFLKDKQVTDRLRCLGYAVEVDSRGSRDMLDALGRGDHGYAFAFPGSTPAAEKIMKTLEINEKIPLFSTPMVVATFQPIVALLKGEGVIQRAANGTDVVDIAALLNLARTGKRWDQLTGNSAFPARKTILLSTTDPQDSNSAIMYLSIASQAANDGAIVTTEQQLQKVLPDLCRLIYDQGGKPDTSQVLFNDYLVGGMGRIPMGLIYEAQYVTKAPAPPLADDSVMLFPRPTIYSRHTLIPLTPDGAAVGKALRDDPTLVRLAAEHGFRPERPLAGQETGEQPVDVVESPSYEVLETMLSALAEDSTRCTQR